METMAGNTRASRCAGGSSPFTEGEQVYVTPAETNLFGAIRVLRGNVSGFVMLAALAVNG